MYRNYRRFDEIREKARLALKKTYGSNQDKLTNAMIEIFNLFESDVPPHRWSEVVQLKEAFKIGKPKSDEGIIRASINEMRESEVQQYMRKIELF